MKKIAIIAALPGELKPLVRGWQQPGPNVWAGRIGDCEAVAVAGGIGEGGVKRAAEQVFTGGGLDALVSYGWAGALTCAVKPPAACVIHEVVDAASGERFLTRSSDGYRLITLDHVARPDEKRGLAEKHQAVLVDMEAATVARKAAARQVPFYCFKGVSDGYTDVLPDFSRFIGGDGELRMAVFLAYVALRPKYWASLKRLGTNSRAAAVALKEMVRESLKPDMIGRSIRLVPTDPWDFVTLTGSGPFFGAVTHVDSADYKTVVVRLDEPIHYKNVDFRFVLASTRHVGDKFEVLGEKTTFCNMMSLTEEEGRVGLLHPHFSAERRLRFLGGISWVMSKDDARWSGFPITSGDSI